MSRKPIFLFLLLALLNGFINYYEYYEYYENDIYIKLSFLLRQIILTILLTGISYWMYKRIKPEYLLYIFFLSIIAVAFLTMTLDIQIHNKKFDL